MSQPFIKSFFKFYRLHQKVILGGVALLVMVLLASGSLIAYNKTKGTSNQQEIAEAVPNLELSAPQPSASEASVVEVIDTTPVQDRVASPTPQPSNKPAISATSTVAASIAPRPSKLPTPQPTPRPTPSINPIASPSPVVVQQPQAAQPTKGGVANETNATQYTVQKGDTLWNIAEKQLGSGYRYNEIAILNSLKSANHIEVGQHLKLPTKEASVTSNNATPSDKTTINPNQGKQELGATAYTVQTGDSLWKIAETQLSSGYRWTEIYELNKNSIGSNPHLIYPNTSLQLPARTGS